MARQYGKHAESEGRAEVGVGPKVQGGVKGDGGSGRKKGPRERAKSCVSSGGGGEGVSIWGRHGEPANQVTTMLECVQTLKWGTGGGTKRKGPWPTKRSGIKTIAWKTKWGKSELREKGCDTRIKGGGNPGCGHLEMKRKEFRATLGAIDARSGSNLRLGRANSGICGINERKPG